MSEENACVINHLAQERRKATVQGSVLGKPNTKGTATCEGKQGSSGGKWVGENEV